MSAVGILSCEQGYLCILRYSQHNSVVYWDFFPFSQLFLLYNVWTAQTIMYNENDNWTNDESENLIEMYEVKEVLWNIRHWIPQQIKENIKLDFQSLQVNFLVVQFLSIIHRHNCNQPKIREDAGALRVRWGLGEGVGVIGGFCITLSQTVKWLAFSRLCLPTPSPRTTSFQQRTKFLLTKMLGDHEDV